MNHQTPVHVGVVFVIVEKQAIVSCVRDPSRNIFKGSVIINAYNLFVYNRANVRPCVYIACLQVLN